MIRWEPALEGDERVPGLPRLADEPPPGPVRNALEIPLLILMAALITFGVKTFVGQAFYIPSASMEPQLMINDRIVVSKISYRIHDPNRGDIVVFDCPPLACAGKEEDQGALIGRIVGAVLEGVGVKQPSTDEYVKRIIGLPGDTVEGKEGRVYVNGMLLDEPYLDPTRAYTTPFPARTIGSDELWVMGDNRMNSSDSRVFGPIKKDSVVGRTVLKVWPFPDAAFL